MSDFHISLNCGQVRRRIVDGLRNREHLQNRRMFEHSFPWGAVVVQECAGRGHEPVQSEDQFFFCAGRPRVVGWTHEEEGPQGFMRRWGPRVCQGVKDDAYEELTGTYVLVACDARGFRILTDRIGMYPVYVGYSRERNAIAAIGSHPELVAEDAGRRDDIDIYSVGEILLRHNTTYPYTTRNGMRELAPGAHHGFILDESGDLRHTAEQLWLPVEPKRWPTLGESRDQLYQALRTAGADIVRGAERVAVTLSGGLDSRAVIGALPKERLVGAVTFINSENHECRIAGKIAAAAGIPHWTARRDPQFYATLPERESALVGMERAAVHAHALVVADCGLPEKFDLLVGGFFCDTMLKAYFAEESARAQLAGRLGMPRRMRDRHFAEHFNWYTYKKAIVLSALRDDVLEGIHERLTQRIAEIRAYRPETAEEWLMFYPESINEGANYALVNTRIMPSDELFLHRDIIEVERTAHQFHKLTKRLVTSVFARIAGPLADLPNANTGLPASAGWLRKAIQRRLMRKSPPVKYEFPWFADHSWIDYHTFQRQAPMWQALRQKAASAEQGLEVLGRVLRDDPRSQIATFNEPLGNRFDFKLVQTALHFERILGDENCGETAFDPRHELTAKES